MFTSQGHNNRITTVPKDVTRLEMLQEFRVAFSSSVDLPGCGPFGSLSLLIIEHNSVSHPSAPFFRSHQKIASIRVGSSPFHCTCELREFITSIGQLSSEVVESWPDSCKCAYPESYKGTLQKDFHVS